MPAAVLLVHLESQTLGPYGGCDNPGPRQEGGRVSLPENFELTKHSKLGNALALLGTFYFDNSRGWYALSDDLSHGISNLTEDNHHGITDRRYHRIL